MIPATPADEHGVTAHLLLGGPGLDDELRVAGADGHHLQRARRVDVGEDVTVADGDGHWRRYRVVEAARGSLHLVAAAAARAERPPPYDIVAAPALVSRNRFDGLVAQLTELGVDAIVPLVAERCVARWDRSDPQRATARLRAVAREAAMQCRRSRMPRVDAPATPAQIASLHARIVVAAREENATDARAARGAPERSECRALVVVSGPEGGLSARDLAELGAHDCLRLGAYVLRAETAPVAAVALLTERRDRRDGW